MQLLLEHLQKFEKLSAAATNAMQQICSEISILKNKDLQPIGHTCRTIYFINKGIARIYYLKDGIDITETFATEKKFIARAESLFSRKPSRKGIQILEDANITAINAVQLFKLYDQYHEIERAFRKIFEAAYVDTISRIESIQFHTAEERYKQLIEDTPGIIQRVPLKYISSYLGITQVSLSRIRSNR